jgi:Protein of unknown function (DUF3617)
MRNTSIAALLGIIALGQTPQMYQPLAVKTGTWESKLVITQSGQLPIPEDKLARLTPEQRAKFEAAMRARMNGQPPTRTYQSCLTSDELNKGSVFNPDKDQCTQKVLTSTSSTVEVQINCQQPEAQTSVHLTFTAVDSGTVTGTGTTTINGGGRTMTSNSQFSSKWISSTCSDKK